MADFPNVVSSNGSGVSLQANIAVVTIGSGASADAGVNYVYDANPVVAGTSYTATVEAKRLAGSTPFRLELKWRKPDGSHLEIATGPTGPSAVGATGTLSVTATAPSGVGKAILCVRYASAPASGESFQTANPGITANPNAPTGNSARRLALLGIETGKFSGLPFNSGVNPAGRSGNYAGYEGIQDQVETARGRKFDVRNAFQYNNRNVSEGSTSWNDLKGMQVLDWFDPQATAVLGMPPFPGGGSWSSAASGAYDAQYVAIGQTIAQKRPSGTAKVVLRLAWEFNGVNGDNSGWYPHVGVNTNGTPRTGFIDGFRRAVTKIREGAGDRVAISWSVAGSTSSQSVLEALYPGDDYVDIIGVDTYDAFTPSPGGVHSESVWLSSSGIGNLFTFAKAHGKLFALDEWGGHATGSYNDGGDNADFPRIVVNWLKNNADYMAYEAQFNAVEAGNVVNNLWATGGTSVQLPNQRAAYIAAYAAL